MMTLKQFVEGMEDTVMNLPSLLDEWETIEEDLQENYVENLEWLMRMCKHFASKADESKELGDRLFSSFSRMCKLRKIVQDRMGIDITDYMV